MSMLFRFNTYLLNIKDFNSHVKSPHKVILDNHDYCIFLKILSQYKHTMEIVLPTLFSSFYEEIFQQSANLIVFN
jgi:hypothetical protein